MPRPRSLDYPIIESITHAIVQESKQDDSNSDKREEEDEIANTIAAQPQYSANKRSVIKRKRIDIEDTANILLFLAVFSGIW